MPPTARALGSHIRLQDGLKPFWIAAQKDFTLAHKPGMGLKILTIALSRSNVNLACDMFALKPVLAS